MCRLGGWTLFTLLSRLFTLFSRLLSLLQLLGCSLLLPLLLLASLLALLLTSGLAPTRCCLLMLWWDLDRSALEREVPTLVSTEMA